MKGMGDILKQAQEMQKQMSGMREEMGSVRVEGISGGGMVKAEVDGKMQLRKIAIDPAAVDPEDVGMLEDLVVLAVQAGQKKAAEEMEKKMSEMTGGLNLPGLFGQG
jgi:nucleoid-associated protein EbfC